MYKISDHLITETGWEVIESIYDSSQSINSGSNFMIGNGYLGYRGTMAEDTCKDHVGCFVTDTWDNADGKWEELCNVPNGLYTQIFIEGTPLSVKKLKPKSFKRILNFKNGVNSVDYTSTFLQNGATVCYHEEKFANQDDYHVIPMKIELSTDKDIHLKIVEGIDGEVWNLNGEHLTNYKMGVLKNSLYFVANTVEKGQLIAVTSHVNILGMQLIKGQLIKRNTGILNEIDGYIKKNQTLQIFKYMCVFHSNECSEPLKNALKDISSYDYHEIKKQMKCSGKKNGKNMIFNFQKISLTRQLFVSTPTIASLLLLLTPAFRWVLGGYLVKPIKVLLFGIRKYSIFQCIYIQTRKRLINS